VARLGLISDTHGLLRPQALDFLRGCQHIVHGGDIGDPEILARLSDIAPVTAVRGNNDRGTWADAIAPTERLEFNGATVYALHDLSLLDIDPVAAGVHVVVSGHSHKPAVEHREGVLYVNPGSAGPRRFRLPIAVAEIVVLNGRVNARIVELEIDRVG
jgi:putative phosphoesterase